MKKAFACMLLTYSLSASATVEGVFWDPAFNGEGWTIEGQNDLAFFTWYTYEDNGDPTFRTALCPLTYEALSLTDLEISCTGTLTVTRDRNDSTGLGPFSAVFRLVAGRWVGDINANGTLRTLEPFNYNFRNSIDFLRGVWIVAELTTEDTDSDTVIFSSEETTLDDGVTPARMFTTVDSGSAPGFVYFDEAEESFIAVQEFEGERGVARFPSTDDKTLGVVFETDAAGNIISELTPVVIASALNTEGETAALGSFLQEAARKAARAPALTIPMTRVPQHTFEQMRAMLAKPAGSR